MIAIAISNRGNHDRTQKQLPMKTKLLNQKKCFKEETCSPLQSNKVILAELASRLSEFSLYMTYEPWLSFNPEHIFNLLFKSINAD